MGKTSAPPINGALIRRARLARFMGQSEVQQALARLGVDIDTSGLSRIESGATKWPAHRTVRGLAELFGLRRDEIYLTEPEEAAEPETEGREEPPLAA